MCKRFHLQEEVSSSHTELQDASKNWQWIHIYCFKDWSQLQEEIQCIKPQELSTLFTYELASHPLALFGMATMIRAANNLATTIRNKFNPVSASI